MKELFGLIAILLFILAYNLLSSHDVIYPIGGLVAIAVLFAIVNKNAVPTSDDDSEDDED